MILWPTIDSVVAAIGIAGVLDEFDKWRVDPVWPEYQHALNDSREYVRTATALCVGNALRVHHPATELVPSKGSVATRDLRMVVTAQSSLAIEVKAPTNVGSRPEWCRGPDLNWRHLDFQSSALPS